MRLSRAWGEGRYWLVLHAKQKTRWTGQRMIVSGGRVYVKLPWV